MNSSNNDNSDSDSRVEYEYKNHNNATEDEDSDSGRSSNGFLFNHIPLHPSNSFIPPLEHPRRARLRRSPLGRFTPTSSPARDDSTRQRKVDAIRDAVNEEPADVTTLRQLAISRGGLLSSELRHLAWARLLNVDVDKVPPKPSDSILHGHRDYQQVVLDVNRSLKRFPPGMEEDIRLAMQDQLVDVIMWVLVHNSELHYYQGFHDICVTFLLVVGERLTFAIMEKLSNNHLRDFMDKNMDKTSHMLNYLYPLVGKASPELRAFLEKAEVGTIFCLSWLITWYGHVLSDFRHIVRLYDFFVACHPLMPIYLGAAIVLYREKEILKCPCEMPLVHSLLSRMPDDLPYEELISRAGDLFIQYPPTELEDEARQDFLRKQITEKLYQISLREKAEERKRLQEQRLIRERRRRWILRVSVYTVTAVLVAAAAVFTYSYKNGLASR